MKLGTRKMTLAVSVGGSWLIAKVALPALLTGLANFGIRKTPGYRGSIRRVRIDFTVPRLVVRGVSLAELNEVHPTQLRVRSVVVGSRWKDIMTGSLIGYIGVESPQVQLDLHGFGHRSATPEARSPAGLDLKPDRHLSWQERVKRLPAFRISSATVRNGEVGVQGIPGQKGTDLKIDRLNLSIENITNSGKLGSGSVAKVICRVRVISDGTLEFRAEGYPLAERPSFNLEFQTRNIDLSELHNLIEHHVGIDVTRGIVDLFVQAAAAEGYIEGYAKPIFDNLELRPIHGPGFVARVKGWVAQILVKVGKNRRKDRVATRLDFEGSLGEPNLNLTDAALRFIRNGFGAAERASFQYWNPFPVRQVKTNEPSIYNGYPRRSKAAVIFGLLKETVSRWSGDESPRMAAALAYYTTFSMAPLLILLIAVAGLVPGHDAA